MLIRQASRQATASQAATGDDPTPPACSIYEAIGRGKHSVVYKGRKKKTIQYYAIKSVDKSQKARVLQEVGAHLGACEQWFMASKVHGQQGCIPSQ